MTAPKLSGSVVDTGAAAEFMGEILLKVPEQELGAIAAECERKAGRFSEMLGDGRVHDLDRADLRGVLRSVFASRGKAEAFLEAHGPGRLASEIDRLLRGSDPVGDRLERFHELFGQFTGAEVDLASELLHFTHPERYWLWSRWMWDPRIETGALRLVTDEELDLVAATAGETYMKVGEALAFVAETGRAVGFTSYGDSPFGIDVFLACVYGIYVYTVLRMRMTQEFNRIVPELPDLVRRLLGVKHPEALSPPPPHSEVAAPAAARPGRS